MGFSNHPPSWLFTNKFLHVSINNKIISINRKEAYTIFNSSIKDTNNKRRSSTRKHTNKIRSHYLYHSKESTQEDTIA
jgi:hypothetical protein